MAKVSGPLMSMDARGAFAGAIVFSAWKGRNVVRQLVKPSNPMTADQQTARNAVRVLGAGQHFASATALKRSGETDLDRVELQALAPSGQAWNGYLVKSAIGAGSAAYTAATTAYNALTAPQKTAWDTAANALVPPIPSVPQKAAGGVPTTALSSGAVFFHYCYGLYIAGAMAAAPGATPPVYA